MNINDIIYEQLKGFKYKVFLEQSLVGEAFYSKNSFLDQNKVSSMKRLELIKKANIFVLEKDIKIISSQEEADSIKNREIPISLPFKTCFFEMQGRSALMSEERETKNGKEIIHMICALIHEESPNNFYADVLIQSSNDGFYFHTYGKSDQNLMLNLIGCLDLILRKSRIGTENINERIKIRNNKSKEKEFIKIKNIIRVSSKNISKESYSKPIIGQSVDWSHRWEVGGHWRRIKSIGKNREGNYDVDGFTWVVPHVKGPEDKIVVKKTRLIQA